MHWSDEIAQKIKDGTMPMNDELDRYIKKLEKDTKEAEKKYDQCMYCPYSTACPRAEHDRYKEA